MHYIPYNSRKGYHKSPFGAVAAGSAIAFSVILPLDFHARCVRLVVNHDMTGQRECVALEWDRHEGPCESWWSGCYTPREPGLLFYHFEYETPHGCECIYHAGKGIGKIAKNGASWQLSVYSPAFTTSDWLKGGVIYQIFPDRFFNSDLPKSNVPLDRILRKDWGAPPQWEPDAHGNINSYDFFGGDLRGIAQKLPLLVELGVTCVYLNPIFEAHSNHRYDTADYLKIDPLLGNEDDFKSLCALARESGIRVILDGVFSHTGADSIYFNNNRRYPLEGAANTMDSPYYPWYKFNHWPDDYAAWWGIDMLPEINEDEPGFIQFITGKDGVARKWLAAGASGWRLDVADELPDAFLEAFRSAVKAEDPHAFILGEVWEDASNKCSYGKRRPYLHGKQLDSVMNYPFSTALMAYIQNGQAQVLKDTVVDILENYPPPAIHTLMNHIGTHDTVRAITQLAGADLDDKTNNGRAMLKLDAKQRKKGLALMKLISAVQFTLPGVPCIYYGDEAGLEGGRDPYNRGCYPWGNEDPDLVDHYKLLGAIRKKCPAFIDGDFKPIASRGGCLAFERNARHNSVLTIANRAEHEIEFALNKKWSRADVLLGQQAVDGCHIKIQANEAVILSIQGD
ncbi:MAG TPA: glycoside hydrolase family 13 protein [Clostridia bacterium]|nr:glycoside hydrolase family 13 protein [Clostridia bacterium]